MSAGVAQAGTLTITNATPVVDSGDIANFTWDDSSVENLWTDFRIGTIDANFGQTFTTKSTGGDFKAVAFRVGNVSGTSSLTRKHSVRVVAVDGTNTTTLALESNIAVAGPFTTNDWYIFTLETPVTLEGNTIYGVDIEMTAGADWQTGVAKLQYNPSDVYAGGNYYYRRDGDPSSFIANTVRDRVFHLDIDAGPPAGTVIVVK